MKKPLAIGAAAFALGVAVGVGWPGREHRTARAVPESVERAEPREPAREIQVKKPEAVGLMPVEEFRRLLSAGEKADWFDALACIGTFSAQDCAEASKALSQAPGEAKRYLADALAKRWAHLDPAGAFAAALVERENDFKNRLGHAAMAELAKIDPAEAFERLSNAKGSSKQYVANWVMRAMARENPALAADYLSRDRSLRKFQGFFMEVANQYARVAPEAALSWAESLEPKRLRDEAKKQALQGWAETDPQAVVARLEAEGSSKQLADVYGNVSRSWSRKDPKAALAWIQTLADKDAKARAWGGFDPDWSTIDPESGRKLIESVQDSGVRENLANRYAHELTRESFVEALKWAESLPAGKARENALRPVFQEWSAQEPAEAARYLAALPEGGRRGEMLQNAIGRWAENEPDAAFGFAQQLPAGKERDEAIGSAINGIRGDDPQKALEWLGSVQDAKVSGKISEELVSAVVNVDPAKAFSLAAQLPAESQPKAYQNLIRTWAFDHTTEAGEWINTLPQGRSRDAAVKAYVSVIDGMDAGLATKWARTIEEPEARAEAFVGAFERWRNEDRKAASDWLAENQLPDDAFKPVIEMVLRREEERRKKD